MGRFHKNAAHSPIAGVPIMLPVRKPLHLDPSTLRVEQIGELVFAHGGSVVIGERFDLVGSESNFPDQPGQQVDDNTPASSERLLVGWQKRHEKNVVSRPKI